LEVIARTSSSQYRSTAKPAFEIGQELGVQYLLTGTVRWDKRPGGSRVRVSPELVDARSGAARWQAPFDAAITDVFQVQGEIAGRVAQALNVELGAKETQALSARPTGNLEAYDAFLRGDAATRQFTTLDPAALRRGLLYYEQAVKLDSSFARAWSRISRAHSILYSTSSSNPADSAGAAKAAIRALALGPDLPDGRLAVGNYYNLVLFHRAEAIAEYRKALRLAPNDASLIGAQVVPEQALGQLEEAALHAREAFRLDPRSTQAAQRVARTMIFLRRYDEAIAAADTAVRLNPASPDAVWTKMIAYVAKGDLEGAHAVYRHAAPELDRVALVAFVGHIWEMAWTLERGDLDLLSSLSLEPFGGEQTDWGLSLAQAWALKGDSGRARIYADSARAAFRHMISRSTRNDQDFALFGLSLAYLGRYDEAIAAGQQGLTPRDPRAIGAPGYNQFNLARIYAMAGRRDSAIATLERVLKLPLYVTPGWLRIDPTFASLRTDPRFQRLTADPTPR
jgi:tetratricopeptide (TPR) repeat protein